ncbi:unnamed protein product, partial [Rotaria sp. Silwood1]
MNHSLHALKDTLSLNEGQPLIRPITEVATLMKENIQPAKNPILKLKFTTMEKCITNLKQEKTSMYLIQEEQQKQEIDLFQKQNI